MNDSISWLPLKRCSKDDLRKVRAVLIKNLMKVLWTTTHNLMSKKKIQLKKRNDAKVSKSIFRIQKYKKKRNQMDKRLSEFIFLHYLILNNGLTLIKRDLNEDKNKLIKCNWFFKSINESLKLF